MRFSFLFLLLSISIFTYAQHPWLVKDINTDGAHTNQLADGTYIGGASCSFAEGQPNMQKMYKVNSFALFFANDGKGKKGLWRSDGTKNGTFFLSNLNLGSTTFVSEAYSTGSLLYFIKYFSINNSGIPKELWRSDGTVAGTFPIFSGTDKRLDDFFWTNAPEYNVKGAALGSNFFFIAARQIGDTVYTNIYKTNGTAAGTTPYFEIYKAKGPIDVPFNVGSSKLIAFNNHIYFTYGTAETGKEIWVGDGINQPHLYCDFNPGPLSADVGQWINLNDQYLILWAAIYNSPSAWSNKILRINSTDACPVIIDEDAGNSTDLRSPAFYDYSSNEYYIADNKFFFKKSIGTGSQFLEATNGEANGTFSVPINAQLAGVCTNGLIFTEGIPYTKTYIWDGNSSTSYHIFSDSLNAIAAKVIQLDTSVFVSANGIVWQTNGDGSYCYRVSAFSMNRGVKLGDTAYLALGNANTSGTFACGTEPVLFKKFDRIWTGKISADWNNSGNWLPAGVPKFSESVVIPPTPYNPVINNQASCKDLFLNNGNQSFNGRGITVNKSANLDVHGYYFSLRGSSINGAGTLTRKGTFANTTFGDGEYKIDNINIDGADWDLTSMNFSYPNNFVLNSVVNFKTDHKLIMNETVLYLLKKPFFTGFNNKRFIVNNRINPLLYNNNPEPISIVLYNAERQADNAFTIPVGTSTSSYSPVSLNCPYNLGGSIYLYERDRVRKDASKGDTVTTGVVNKSWFMQNGVPSYDTLKLSWIAADEASGFNHNSCFIAGYNGSKWIQGSLQTAVLKNGLYSVQQIGFDNIKTFIVCSDFNVISSTYTFIGDGNWNVASNWSNNKIPPSELPTGSEIIINPSANSECILNVHQTILAGAKFTLLPGKKLKIAANLDFKK